MRLRLPFRVIAVCLFCRVAPAEMLQPAWKQKLLAHRCVAQLEPSLSANISGKWTARAFH